MNSPLWYLILPAIQLFTVWRIHNRIHYTRYMALLAYLCTEATAGILRPFVSLEKWAEWFPYQQPVRMFLLTAVCFEIFKLSCKGLPVVRQCWLVSKSIGFAVVSCASIAAALRLTPWESFAIFRQFYLIAICAVLVGGTLEIWYEPIVENQDHKAYRIIMTYNMVKVAAAATFVRGGLGYLLLPYSAQHTWAPINLVMYLVTGGLTLALAYGMTTSYSATRPDVLARRAAASR